MFDGPIFRKDNEIKNGWVNIGLFSGNKHSPGLCWPTREKAAIQPGNIIYRIHVKVKEHV